MNLEKIQAVFHENFANRDELGASVSVWEEGREVLSLAGGYCDRAKTTPWKDSTLALVWSATKGVAAACVLHCLQRHWLALSTRVAEIWPEFAQGGKESVTIGELLSHQAGLPALDAPATVLDYQGVIKALEEQRPLWPSGQGHGYHPRTIGFLMDELVRRMEYGVTLGNYWREHFAEPLGLDFWIGLPADEFHRTAPMYAARGPVPERDGAFYEAFGEAGSFTFRAFTSPQGLNGVSAMNTPEIRMASFPAFGGIGSASALGKFYAMLTNGGESDGRRFFSEESLRWMKTPLTNGPDRVLLMQTSFSAGLMKDPVDAAGRKVRAIFGPSAEAFGQPGAGGSVAFADPENNVAFAYVMNQMGPGVLPNEKALGLIAALY